MIRASVIALLLFAGSARAQTRIPGRVLDPQEKPVANIEVLLHSITEEQGTQVDRDTSKADGSFELSTTAVNPDAVYFVTVVYNNQLYMGEMMRAPFPTGQEYIVRAGVNPIDIGAAVAAPAISAEAAKKDRTAGMLVIMVAALLIAGITWLSVRRRPPTYRRWLVELARLEDELAVNPDDGLALKRRGELRARLLAPRSG